MEDGDQRRKVEQLWYCMLKAAPLDTLQISLLLLGRSPLGIAREGEGGQDGAVEPLGHDEHTATWAEKHQQGEC